MLCPVKVSGREKIDKGKPYVFVANHQGAFDIFLIYGFLGVPFKWMMKAGIGKIPFVGSACRAAGFIFVDNSTPKKAAKSVFEAEKCLKSGTSMVVFPEGSRTNNGKMAKFKKGAFQIAVDRKTAIVPITINGSYDVLRIGSLNVRPHRMEMVIHDSIHIPEDMDANHKNLQNIADKVQEVVASDLWDKYK
jgi:1-acyl-sn-glycerol-3-phosphate acyltransferase